MNTIDTYLAVFLGQKTSPGWKAWDAMSDDERRAKEQKGMAAWNAWVDKHRDAIVFDGGPLGKTKRISRDGVADSANELAVFIVVRASSHEAAAKMFEGHPHFAIFPGEAVEVMPLLPIPRT
jgi:hypothetical protein